MILMDATMIFLAMRELMEEPAPQGASFIWEALFYCYAIGVWTIMIVAAIRSVPHLQWQYKLLNKAILKHLTLLSRTTSK